MPFKGRRQSKISLKENGVVSFNPKKNANIFSFSQIQQTHYCWNVHVEKANLESKPLETIIRRFVITVRILFLHNVDITSVEMIFKNLDIAKASGIDQISVRFLEDSAPVIAIHSYY